MSKDNKQRQPLRYRSVFISDAHLGTAGSQAEALSSFLKHCECENLYLVGDIIDGWRLRSTFFWPQEHTNVIRRILTKSRRGTQVYYVTGNHDDFLRKFVDYELRMGNIQIVNDAVHVTADNRKLFIIHGDLFDVVTRYHRWVARIGDVAYVTLLRVNRYFNNARARLGYPYFSLSAYAKHKVKSAVNFISEFEKAVAHECRRRGFDGVVCGHIHHAEMKTIEGVSYYNSGDWVESATALVEHFDGRMEIVHWNDIKDTIKPSNVHPLRVA
ncbi:UDP-2,3-diacylglucosamine diphosphatase [Salinisphaera sp.]|uniref:UDP-2,3-diacylglucosamine diphosphatase n=1 Tax=Salinisphaera sp. TaxID=1914330 RepID=UPI000C564178|nr:UDP-2,3-diacylglucosamine diphosphatase [Salinisphaera sp.]MBS61841.1 UDP-2,3-diacylglucosamine hydrolase [Salinisphaera sp.]